LKECAQVSFKISIVSKARFRVVVQTDLDISVLQLLSESCKGTEAPHGEFPGCLLLAEVERCNSKGRRQHGRQRPMFRSSHQHCLNSHGFSIFSHLVEQNGFAHAS